MSGNDSIPVPLRAVAQVYLCPIPGEEGTFFAAPQIALESAMVWRLGYGLVLETWFVLLTGWRCM
jgi:hypothetical protein